MPRRQSASAFTRLSTTAITTIAAIITATGASAGAGPDERKGGNGGKPWVSLCLYTGEPRAARYNRARRGSRPLPGVHMGETELVEIESRIEQYPSQARHDILRLTGELRRLSSTGSEKRPA